MANALFLTEYPALLEVVRLLDCYLKDRHPHFFGSNPIHPALPVKRSKILHDNLWGTNRYYWRELVIIDSPIFQRLRDIHQVGLAFQVYMSARHSRFEHSLGVVTIASRIFDAIQQRKGDGICDILTALGLQTEVTMVRLKQELRLAALLHDIGHSIHSHTSEQVYENINLLKSASKELTKFVGKDKGAGEVISFCLTLTDSLAELLNRASKKLIGDATLEDFTGEIDLVNVALIIVGRSTHPFLQFLGDIISSGFDADKIDYLMRDATNAGLPLRYDLDRYLFSVSIEKEILADGDKELKKLYSLVCQQALPDRVESHLGIKYAHYKTYRLRLPEKAMNTIEQIVICKLMLYSYIYHHQKVRASEGMLRRLLEKIVNAWKCDVDDKEIIKRFLDITDSSLHGFLATEASKVGITEYPYRLIYRLLPREVYCLTGVDQGYAEGKILTDFLTDLQDKSKSPSLIRALEDAIGDELIKIDSNFGSSAEEALFKAGVWVDLPKPPKFEDVDELIVSRTAGPGYPLRKVFPINEWTDAYTHYRYPVRIFAFSEYTEFVKDAAKNAMKLIINIKSEEFYKNSSRVRD